MIEIVDYTTKTPITMIGEMSGVCYGSNITDPKANYKRGLDCLKSEHGRTWEFPDVYMVMSEYSCKVMREFYTHIGGSPTRLQESTRYVNFSKRSDDLFIVPPTVPNQDKIRHCYAQCLGTYNELIKEGVKPEDASFVLPLGLKTKVAVKINFRTLVDMSHQRLCSRAFHEYRKLMTDIQEALSNYSPEWKYMVNEYFKPKCEYLGYCSEAKSCGRVTKKNG